LVSEIGVGTTFWFDLAVYHLEELKKTKNIDPVPQQEHTTLVTESSSSN
jgi:hypothetical protein